jgi:hypothetical protein
VQGAAKVRARFSGEFIFFSVLHHSPLGANASV